MPSTSAQITYAVSLHPAKEAEEAITSAVKSLAEVTGDSFILKSQIPPHLTLGAFHGTKEKEARLIQLLEDFAKEQMPGAIQYNSIGTFKQRVIFLQAQKDSFLTKINSELHTLLLKEFQQAENGYYLPQVWVPHTALATRVNQNRFAQALKKAEEIKLPLETQAKEISLYRCYPFTELKRIPLA